MELKIELDIEQVSKTMEHQAQKAVVDGLSCWNVQKAMRDQVELAVAESVMGEMLRQAVSSVDMEKVAQELTREIGVAIREAVLEMVLSGISEAIFKIRGGEDWHKGSPESKATIREQLSRRVRGDAA